MKSSGLILMAALLTACLVATAGPQQDQKAGPMPWAYAGDAPPNTPPTPGATPPAPDPAPKHTPTSTLSFTLAQVRSGAGDWHPEDHGAMPDIVAHGRPPAIIRCSQCHMHNGRGRMENAPVAGLPVEYFMQTMADFKNGLRPSAEPKKGNAKRMAMMAKDLTDEETRAAAEYYAAIPFPSEGWIKVVETKTVPKTELESDALRIKLDGNATEPLGDRIVEVPDNTEATEELRDDHSPFTAYVPIGAVKKGEILVTTGGNGKTVQCALCHGDKLQGIGPVPPLAGRTPSYLARQIYDMEHGFRKGPWTPLMMKAVSKLTDDDILDISAYITSLPAAPPLAVASKMQ